MRKILVIEDTENNQIIIGRRLKSKGYDVHLRANAEEGILAARELRPHLILMDIGLPTMDGWDATRILKDDDATRNIPVIALTAHAMAGDREKALEARCDEYETKPIDFTSLFGKIETLIARHAPEPGGT